MYHFKSKLIENQKCAAADTDTDMILMCLPSLAGDSIIHCYCILNCFYDNSCKGYLEGVVNI